MTGNGVYAMPNGDRYEGKWLRSKKTGKGNYYWSSGEAFQGEFVEDEIREGKFFKNDGTTVEIDLR